MRSDYSYLFLLTYGRSGSTVLMKLLNWHPNIHVTGENQNALFRIFQTFEALDEAAQRTDGRDTVDHPWYGGSRIDRAQFREAVLEHFVQDVLNAPPEATRIGFKEIRYMPHLMSDNEFEAYVAFLLTEFPDARIVFNTRNWEAVAKSGWNAKRPRKEVQKRIETMDKRFQKAHETWPDQTILFDYSDLQFGNPQLRATLDFAGAKLDDDKIREVLETPLTHLKKPLAPPLPARAFRKLKRLISQAN